MYPDRELTLLAAHKASLRREIAVRRVHCAEAAARVARPLAWLDRVLVFGRRLSPLAALVAVPAGLLLQRTLFSRLKFLGPLLRWGPAVLAVVRGFGRA